MLLAQACPALAFQEMLRRHRQAVVLQWRLSEENQKKSKNFILICTRMKKDHSLLMDKAVALVILDSLLCQQNTDIQKRSTKYAGQTSSIAARCLARSIL